jgi:hypothetical protein
MSELVAQLVAALERDGIPFCQWKGAAALEHALRGERDLDGLVPAAAWPRALASIEGAGWKRAQPHSGEDEAGVAHFFAYEPGQERLLHLHLHDRVLSGEDWINSHALPFDTDLLASTRRAHGVRVPEPAAEAALAVLKHAIRWGSLPDRITAWLRPKDESAELRALLVEPIVSQAAVLVCERAPALDERTFRACAAALCGEGAGNRRRRLAAQVRRALLPWSRYGQVERSAAYLRLVLARIRRALDGNRRERVPAGGSCCLELVAPDPAQAERAAVELDAWLGQAFRTQRLAAASGAARLCVGEVAGARVQRIDLASLGDSPAALRSAVWSLL